MQRECVSVNEAAWRGGYNSAANFTTAFMSHFGISLLQGRARVWLVRRRVSEMPLSVRRRAAADTRKHSSLGTLGRKKECLIASRMMPL
jgi:AraC-like DNA-binding protein